MCVCISLCVYGYVSVRLENERCSGGTVDSCQGGMECLAGRCSCPHTARPTADRQHCLRPTEKLLGQQCSPTFDTCLHKSGNCMSSYLLRLSSSRASRHIGQQLDVREDDPSQCLQPLPMSCWLSSGLPGMFCAMTSLDVLFFTATY